MFSQNLQSLAFLRISNTAVLIHGCHVDTTDWTKIIVGNLPNLPGRAARGLEAAWMFQSKCIIWGTGASEKHGLKEAELIFDEAFAHISEIAQYMNRNQEITSAKDLAWFMRSKSILEQRSQTTTQEIDNAARIAQEKDCTIIFQISSPTHIERCYHEALKWNEQHPTENILFVPISSAVSYANSTAKDVVIVEPPHRSDRSTLRLERLVKAFLKIRKMSDEQALVVAEALCKTLERHDIKCEVRDLHVK